MIVHVVLFRPKAGLAPERRAGLVGAIERAHREIPGIRRFLVGTRTARDTTYAGVMPDFPYLAQIELDDKEALRRYLEHPAHAELGQLFWETSDAALAYDYEALDASAAARLLT